MSPPPPQPSQIHRYLCDRYVEIEIAVRDKGGSQSERAQVLRALLAADLLHGGPTDRKTVLQVTKQIREFFAKVRKALSTGPST